MLGFFQVDLRTWAAQAYDENFQPIDGAGGWLLIRSQLVDDETVLFDCHGCPDYSAENPCVHVLLLSSDDPPSLEPVVEEELPTCVLFWNTSSRGRMMQTLFVVSSSRKGREIVCHEGRNARTGKWTCRKCSEQNCEHVRKAKKHEGFEHLFEDDDDEEQDDLENDERGLRPAENEEDRGWFIFLADMHTAHIS
ncbi:hypothetical protein AURDEDRAFT_173886 [Auricularia subglabra TFB-10046 SS5]|nr:hypothetical protein AURDEDRAFT_173886 [Auricularia subglabra TFB-10046 SS5]